MSNYGPLKWYRDAKQLLHIDHGDQLASGVTLANLGTAVATLESVSASGARTDITSQVTITLVSIATGNETGVALAGVYLTIAAVTAGSPSAGDNYRLQIRIDNTQTSTTGEQEVLEAELVISD